MFLFIDPTHRYTYRDSFFIVDDCHISAAIPAVGCRSFPVGLDIIVDVIMMTVVAESIFRNHDSGFFLRCGLVSCFLSCCLCLRSLFAGSRRGGREL